MSNQLIKLIFILFCVANFTGCKPYQKAVDQPKKSAIKRKSVGLSPITIPTHENWSNEYSIKQKPIVSITLTTLDHYEYAFAELNQMIGGKKPINFKKAVFEVENAYYKDTLSYTAFNNEINSLVKLSVYWMKSNPIHHYPFQDSTDFLKNAAIFHVISDTIRLLEDLPIHFPFNYNFEDYAGLKNWSSQFVSTLLNTGSGNCHSLPYLYKILADELQTEAYLSLAPNHIYVKHKNAMLGWYNTELTSSQFPTDAWIKASGYITLEAIRNGIYMDTLSKVQNIALCMYDLGNNYFKQTKNFTDGFVIKCCDNVLNIHSGNINAMILKAEILRRLYELYQKNGDASRASITYEEMQTLFVKGVKLGYREMPLAMYQAWLLSITEQQNFINQKVNNTFNNKE